LVANFGFYLDGLSLLWMLFVTGLGALIALYASEYMEHDFGLGYCRFFGAFSLFVFSMLALVMADNLVLLYLGWEGVGLCSYLLIGYFYKKPSAVAAAKKAFIVNRIGDLGLALGIFLIYVQFGTVEYAKLFDPETSELMYWFELALQGEFGEAPAIMQAIAGLLMIGAFGKSAQFPLYVWLPDAMEGPTPVSALIHAATMVTAGVFLIARMFPVFAISEWALPVVAWVGVITALLAATIGMAQFDIKRIMAYSTVSQLGYMFAGLGALTTVGAASHVFTHAFFKAALFLCCGAVMHGMAGQLDLRKISGLWGMKGWGITSFAMLIGCLNLAGFPLLAGYFSKDMIIAEMFVTPHYGFTLLGWVLLITAGLTAYYTFRVFFRVFVGPAHAEPGDDHHGDDDADHAEDKHDFHPHAPGKQINFVLATLVVLMFGAIPLMLIGDHHGWVGDMVHHSTAEFETPYSAHADHGAEAGASHGEDPGQDPAHAEDEHAALAGNTFFGFDPHVAMFFVSGAFGRICTARRGPGGSALARGRKRRARGRTIWPCQGQRLRAGRGTSGTSTSSTTSCSGSRCTCWPRSATSSTAGSSTGW
jgi:NADH-quinone oxidoreductase subunit L